MQRWIYKKGNSHLSNYFIKEDGVIIDPKGFFLKKEGFFKTFVVLILRYRKIEKD